MNLNVNMKDVEKSGWNILCAEGLASDGNELWFSNSTYNGLFRMDMNFKNIVYVGQFQEEPQMCNLHSNCYIYREHILFVPFNAKSVCVYDMTHNQWSYYPIYTKDKKLFKACCISWQNQQYVYMLSSRLPVIVRFDLQNMDVCLYENWYYEFLNQFPDEKYSNMFWWEVWHEGQELYIPYMRGNVVYKVNLTNEDPETIFVNNNIRGIMTICKYNSEFFISTTEGEIYKGDFKEKENQLVYVGKIKGKACKSLRIKESVWFMPMEKPYISFCTCEENAVYDYKLNRNFKELEKCLHSYHIYDENLCYFVHKETANTYYVQLFDGYVYKINQEGFDEETRLVLDKKNYLSCMSDSLKKRHVFFEDAQYRQSAEKNILGNSLASFLERVKYAGSNRMHREKMCGKNIYNS